MQDRPGFMESAPDTRTVCASTVPHRAEAAAQLHSACLCMQEKGSYQDNILWHRVSRIQVSRVPSTAHDGPQDGQNMLPLGLRIVTIAVSTHAWTRT